MPRRVAVRLALILFVLGPIAPGAPALAQPETLTWKPIVDPPEPAFVPPTSDQLERLRSGTRTEIQGTLIGLLQRASTPELIDALDDAEPRLRAMFGSSYELANVACFRARDPRLPLPQVIAALDRALAPGSGIWGEEHCIVDAVARRALDDPATTLPVLVRAALAENGSRTVLRGLGRLDPPTVPPDIRIAMSGPARGRAVVALIAMGAARKWPELVDRAVNDASPTIRLMAVVELASRDDADAHRLFARALARNPRELTDFAENRMFRKHPVEAHLVAIALDAREPSFARAHAAYLVGAYGTADGCRRIYAMAGETPALARAREHALALVEQRHGVALRPAGGAR